MKNVGDVMDGCHHKAEPPLRKPRSKKMNKCATPPLPSPFPDHFSVSHLFSIDLFVCMSYVGDV